jgi:hypothetical protein
MEFLKLFKTTEKVKYVIDNSEYSTKRDAITVKYHAEKKKLELELLKVLGLDPEAWDKIEAALIEYTPSRSTHHEYSLSDFEKIFNKISDRIIKLFQLDGIGGATVIEYMAKLEALKEDYETALSMCEDRT